MFIGHIAVALGAKKVAPKASLGTLLISAQFLDLLWPVLLILGIEHVRIEPGNTAMTPLDFYDYPISHSLLTSVGWSILFALGCDLASSAILISASAKASRVSLFSVSVGSIISASWTISGK